MGNFLKGQVRTCDTTGLPICLNAQPYIQLNAVMAVVFLLIGAVAGLLQALTRWSAVQLLPVDWFYRIVTVHGISMLIFWMIFMEIAILYFTGTTLLKSRLFSKGVALVSFALMFVGSVMVEVIVFMGKGDVLMTSYVPLKAHPLFYLGLILFAVGALVGVFNFFGTIYIARRDKTFEGSMPLVTYGAMAAAVIAVVTILHGAAALIPTLLWSLDWIKEVDPAVYRLLWWGLGHSSQQINVAAMVAVWYLMATLTTGAKPLNEALCRGAFVLYILFINLASAHHLLVDPGVGAGWKIWNTSYAMYLAVLASMIHGLTVPAAVEVAMRRKGYGSGLFQWLKAAPWKDPGFSAFFLSLVIFGFLGGITGVTLGTHQINIIAHNTLRIPGHFHATVAGGTTLAFMGLAYYVVPIIFRKEFYFRGLARLQPYLFAVGISIMSIGMSLAGSYGVPRRTWSIGMESFDAVAHIMLGLTGIGGILVFLGVLAFVTVVVPTVFFGRSIAGQPMKSWQTVEEDRKTKAILGTEAPEGVRHHIPGVAVLVVVFLLTFGVYYFANWSALADVWYVR